MFSIEAVGLGDLSKVTLGHNILDQASGWTVEKVVVKETKEEQEPKEYVFPCNQWVLILIYAEMFKLGELIKPKTKPLKCKFDTFMSDSRPLDCEEGDNKVERELQLEGADDENKDQDDKEAEDKDADAES